MESKCIWLRQPNGWFEGAAHANEDQEHKSVQNVWRFCPYCGKEIAFGSQADGGGQHG